VTVNLVILAEGATEGAFIREVLAPALLLRGVFVEARLIRTSKAGRGGGVNLDRVRSNLRAMLLQRGDIYVSTLLDLYALGPTFPDFVRSKHLGPAERAAHIESRLADDIVSRFACRPDRFIPHVQPYEFEALLFSDVSRFHESEPEWRRYHGDLKRIRDASQTPEHINDSPLTAPFKRLEKLLRPAYKKVKHGSDLASRIGLDAIRAACPHFRSWFDKLANLQPL
jgi:hypothetical protein